jgi:hypothetical protein
LALYFGMVGAELIHIAIVGGVGNHFPVSWIAGQLSFGLLFSALALRTWRTGPSRNQQIVASALALLGLYFVFPDRLVNHWAFLLWVLVPVPLLNVGKASEALVLARYWRFLFVGMMFGAGLQKALFGLYDHAEMLIYLTVTLPGMADSWFAWTLPPGLRETLAQHTVGVGAGPYRTESWLPRLLSVGSVGVEMALPLLMLWRRTQLWATAGCIVFLFGIQIDMGIWHFAFQALPFSVLFTDPFKLRRFAPYTLLLPLAYLCTKLI